MMRSALLWASQNPFLAERLPRYGFFRAATRRFMPGERLEDALAEAARLREASMPTTVTLLGENHETVEQADQVVDHYLGVQTTIAASGLDTEVSVKLTQLGLDFGADVALERLSRLAAAAPNSLLWIDMEYSSYVDETLEIFRAVRAQHTNVGLCLQSYLHRTAADLEALLPLDPAIRLVKGAYNEPATVAFPRKEDVDQSFIRLTRTLLLARHHGGAGRPVIGTHDPRMVGETNRLAHELGMDKTSYEFAMLYGIQRDQQDRLARAGHQVRVLISYGEAWFPWYMRRLAERPANVWFVMKQMLG